MTARALREGVIDYARARLICELTAILSDQDAATAEARVRPAAGQQTTGRLRAALARAVLAVDPGAAARRREQALKDPRVRRWQEDAGSAALAGYGLPPAEVLAADQQLTSRALDYRAAGAEGSLDELRAQCRCRGKGATWLFGNPEGSVRVPGRVGACPKAWRRG